MISPHNSSTSILMCGNAAYFQHIAACLISLVENNPEIVFSVVVVATDWDESSNRKLLQSFKNYDNIEINIKLLNPAPLEKLPQIKAWPKEIYARFWIEDYFPADVERVIYLDGDMVIRASVKPLIELDLEKAMLAAVCIPGSKSPSRLGYDPNDGYFNSGVMVINLAKWRAEKARDLLIKTTFDLVGKLNDPDQDALNYCFRKEYIRLDYVWNAISPFFKETHSLELPEQEIARVRREARIIHFNGQAKPWNYLSFHPHTKYYLQCVAKTEWRGFEPRGFSIKNFFKKHIINTFGEYRVGRAMTMFRRVRSGSR
ncbi:glycosyltransferase family 8 protein [Massilia sp. UBA6681]|uniref:glycosyltransferase family 8 protein n=1 Tax=Massilia sp. UBA6681 TaxID=1946839 RepID=UPI0025B9E305|nr:glycosyltransferase family 8 protein [Massilia sp. UBA6681]